jgi:hypothetical protein
VNEHPLVHTTPACSAHGMHTEEDVEVQGVAIVPGEQAGMKQPTHSVPFHHDQPAIHEKEHPAVHANAPHG